MQNTVINKIIKTDKSLSEVKDAVKRAFVYVGGTMQDTPTGIFIDNGALGVSFSELADITANVWVVNLREAGYQVVCRISWRPSLLNCIMIFLGLFVFGVAWFYSLLYLFIKPEDPYLRALNTVEALLE